MSDFGKFAAKAVGDYADNKLKDAIKDRDQNAIDAWKEGGSARVGLHALVGGISGGLSGAAGAFASASVAGELDRLQISLKDSFIKAGIDANTADTLAKTASNSLAAGIGAVASGGTAIGAATAVNEDANNRQLHQTEIDLAKKYAKQVAKAGGITEEEAIARIERQLLRWVNAATNNADGGKVDELVLSQIGISGSDPKLGIAWDYRNFSTKNVAEYNDPTINQTNVTNYSPLITKINTGKTPAELDQQVHDGKVTAVTTAGCLFSLGLCALMSGFNIGEGSTKIGNGEFVKGGLQLAGGLLSLGGTLTAASKVTTEVTTQLNSSTTFKNTGTALNLGATTDNELSTLTGLNGTGAYAPKTTGNSVGYSGLTMVDANGKPIPGAVLPGGVGKVGTKGGVAIETATTQGSVKILPGAVPDANELRASEGLAQLGYDVSHQPTASSQGITNQRTADLFIKGVGEVDVYTPKSTTSVNGITKAIEAKADQASGVLVQVDLSSADMTSIAARTWGKPNTQNIQTLFFQKSDGTIVRFDRLQGGK